MRILLDTNILIHAYNRDSPHNAAATTLITQAVDDENDACIALQSIHEFYAVITSPRRLEKPLTPRHARELTETILRTPKIRKLEHTQDTAREALALAEKHGVKGADFFDILLASTAIQNNVDLILTENVKDFKDYEIRTENPFNT